MEVKIFKRETPLSIQVIFGEEESGMQIYINKSKIVQEAEESPCLEIGGALRNFIFENDSLKELELDEILFNTNIGEEVKRNAIFILENQKGVCANCFKNNNCEKYKNENIFNEHMEMVKNVLSWF